MHQKFWFSEKPPTEINRISTYRRFPKAKVDYLFLFPATDSVTCRSYYLSQDTARRPLTPSIWLLSHLFCSM